MSKILRPDGRKYNEIRKVKVTRNFIKFAEGSVLFEMGETKVVCTASIENKVPPFLRDSGQGWISAEYNMIPRSSEIRIPREGLSIKPRGRTQEIQRIIGRSLRSVVNLENLGERTIWLDCDVIQADGGTRVASITGSFIALYDAIRHVKKEGKMKDRILRDFIAGVSVGKEKDQKLLDLCFKEDSAVDLDLNVVMTAGGRYVEIQGTGEKRPFEKQELEELLELAGKGIRELIKIEKEVLKTEELI
ncbi:MAG: ribonuclease PH [bacterium]